METTSIMLRLVFFVLTTTLLGQALSQQPTQSPKQKQVYPDRMQFAAKLSEIRSHDSKERVERLVGKPQDVWRAPDPVPYPTDEIWCYGSEEHLSLPTLGQVCFRKGRVIWVAGYRGLLPHVEEIDESELRAGMRFLHPGPEAPGYNDPLHLIRVVNYLQPLGKTKALVIIGEYSRISNVAVDQTWLFLLLRALFEVPDPPGHMPEMRIGRMHPSPPEDRMQFPRFPIVIVDDIPFSVLFGVSIAGQSEPVSFHVEYFQKFGTLRSTQLRPSADPYLSFQKLLESREWASLAQSEHNRIFMGSYEGHTFLQVLALGRTAYDPPQAREPFAYGTLADFERHHKSFVEVGARWDEQLQMYVRKDGNHGSVGHLSRR